MRLLEAVSDNGRYGSGSAAGERRAYRAGVSRAVRKEDEEVDGAFGHLPEARFLLAAGQRLCWAW